VRSAGHARAAPFSISHTSSPAARQPPQASSHWQASSGGHHASSAGQSCSICSSCQLLLVDQLAAGEHGHRQRGLDFHHATAEIMRERRQRADLFQPRLYTFMPCTTCTTICLSSMRSSVLRVDENDQSSSAQRHREFRVRSAVAASTALSTRSAR
jgi:hypothetical protein